MRATCCVLILLCGVLAAGELPSPVTATPPPPVPTSPTPAWTAFAGIKEPDSAYYDIPSGNIFVVNVVGRGGKKEGQGWITKLAPDGKVVAEKWVTGLNAPRGARTYHSTLWVTDIDELVGIAIAGGEIKQRIKLDGAKFLNDVTAHPDGTLYVSDTAGNRIYAVKDGKASVFSEGETLDNPNGLCVDAAGGRLIVAGWGNVGQKRAGSLYQLDLKTKEKKVIAADLGHLNGLELNGKGGYIVTDSIAGRLIHVFADGKSEVLMQFSSGCGDLFYLPEQGLLIVPVMTEGVVSAFTYRP